MPTLVIVGAQWGDEAKGKIVDVLGGDSRFVVRFSGGNNAGHTVIAKGQTYKFQLLPAGILHRGTTAILGGGMAICPKSLVEELDRTRSQSPVIGDLLISPAAHVVFPYHRLLDRLEEEARGANKIGTTSRGIGPCYTDKVQRIGIRMGELVHPERFRVRLQDVLAVKNRLLAMFGEAAIPFEDLYEEYSGYARTLAPFVQDTEAALQEAVARGDRVLFEGAQGSLLDLDDGTYPYVTSSHPIAGGACIGTGIGPRDIDSVLGVCKAYATRVGEGPFPTELNDETGATIRERGHEFGTVTGRPRRCGWLDLVALRHAARLNSLSGLIVTRVDVLSGLPAVSAAVAYTAGGKRLTHMPSTTDDWASVEPVLETFPGWTGELSTARTLGDLPVEARNYLEFVADQTGTPVAIVSVGPDRDETIIVRPDLIWG